MKKKIIIIGSKGMAGHVILHQLSALNKHHLVDIARDKDVFEPSYQCDVSHFDKLNEIIKKEKPDVIINCIGVLNKDAENHPEKAILLNSYLPHFLAQLGNKLDYKLIHISTDCVFSGVRGGYKENDLKDGVGFYAQSKALGEVTYGNHLTIRTSIVGPELKSKGIGLFHWFMQQTGEIKGYTQAYWTGVTTFELAKAIENVLENNVTGLIHLVNDEKISKYKLLNIFSKIFHKKDVNIKPSDDYKIDKSLVRENLNFDYNVPGYEQMIDEMKEAMSKFRNLYTQYDY